MQPKLAKLQKCDSGGGKEKHDGRSPDQHGAPEPGIANRWDTLGLVGALDGFAITVLLPVKANALIIVPYGSLTNNYYPYLSQYFLSHESSLLAFCLKKFPPVL